MTFQIEVHQSVILRLFGLETPGVTNLYGVVYEGKILVMGFGQDPPRMLEREDFSEEDSSVGEKSTETFFGIRSVTRGPELSSLTNVSSEEGSSLFTLTPDDSMASLTTDDSASSLTDVPSLSQISSFVECPHFFPSPSSLQAVSSISNLAAGEPDPIGLRNTELRSRFERARIRIRGPSKSEESIASKETSETETDFDHRHMIYPTGIDHIGAFLVTKGPALDTISSDVKNLLTPVLSAVCVLNRPLILDKNVYLDEISIFTLEDMEKTFHPFTVMNSVAFEANFCYLNLHASVNISLPVRPKSMTRQPFPEFEQLSKRISEEMIFRVGKSDLYISLNPVFHNLQSSVGRVFDTSKARAKDFRSGFEVLNINGLFPATLHVVESKSIYAPYVVDSKRSTWTEALKEPVTYDEDQEKFLLTFRIPLDGLILAYRHRSIQNTYNILIDAAERSLYLAEQYIRETFEDPHTLYAFKVYHFLPEELGHPVSLIYYPEEPDEDLVEVRKKLHECFNLREDRPVFKKGLALWFRESDEPKLPLLNVHVGLRPAVRSRGGRQCVIVEGSYQYFHYNQGAIRDEGWGGAYRSLQTIVSWFLLQGYTTNPVPTILDIQEELVKIGDKPPEFLGSSTCIGSTEVSYVLQSYLGDIGSIIINLQNGGEMATMGPTLLEHFVCHCTPVMIGGGKMAHTILGVDFDDQMTDLRFLILDPHYTGEDDIPTIHEEGGVAWRRLDFWSKRSFYNMCLPVRPMCI